MKLRPLRQPCVRQQRGLSIISLLVAMAVGLVLTLAVSGVLVSSEGRNRGQMAVNDINQTGGYVSHILDGAVRSAGSGFAARWAQTYGCRLNVTRNGSTLLPRNGAWPVPFAAFPTDVRVAPVLVGKGLSAAGSDVLAVMRGNAGFGEMPLEVLALGPPLGLRNTLGLTPNELLLLADGQGDCLLLQAGAIAVDTVELSGGGRYHTVTGAGRTLADFAPVDASTVAAMLGNAGPATGVAANPPLFMLYGVGANRTLFAQDLLAIDSATPQPLTEGVVELRALYGVDNNNDGALDTWVDPGASPWDIATLMDGSAASQQNMARIVAIRLGLILRTGRAERETVASNITLFTDLDASLHHSRVLSADEARVRHRVLELTVPLRNALLASTP
jgi:type IV pilus assembly protein PilW